jgi:hypothetical protein
MVPVTVKVILVYELGELAFGGVHEASLVTALDLSVESVSLESERGSLVLIIPYKP